MPAAGFIERIRNPADERPHIIRHALYALAEMFAVFAVWAALDLVFHSAAVQNTKYRFEDIVFRCRYNALRLARRREADTATAICCLTLPPCSAMSTSPAISVSSKRAWKLPGGQ